MKSNRFHRPNAAQLVGVEMQYKDYCRYAKLATRFASGEVSAEQVLVLVGAWGLEWVKSHLAAGRPDYTAYA